MARLPYADLKDPALQPLVERIVAERGSVLHLYQMLLHSPPVADGWRALLTAVRQQCSLPGRYRELAVNREVAYVEEKGATCTRHSHRRNHTVYPDKASVLTPVFRDARAS